MRAHPDVLCIEHRKPQRDAAEEKKRGNSLFSGDRQPSLWMLAGL